MKKVLSVFLSIVMLLSITVGLDFSAYANTSGDYEYTVLDDGTVEITKYNGSNSIVVIPSWLNGYKVSKIGGYSIMYHYNNDYSHIFDGDCSFDRPIFCGAFSNCKNLTSVVIPDTVTTIGSISFSRCSNLKYLKIGIGVTRIEDNAFCNCDSMESLEIPDNVTSIGSSSFENCKSLKNLVIGNGVKNIEAEAFRNCDSLTSLIIPDSVVTLGAGAFSFCDALKEAIIGCNIEKFGYVIFRTTDNEMGDSWYDRIGAFQYCNNLTNVIIKDGAKFIGENEFYKCSKLRNITIPDSVVSIAGGAFAYCDSLEEVTIPENIISVEGGAYAYCNGLEKVSIIGKNKKLGHLYCYYYGDGFEPCGIFESCKNLKSVTIDDGITNIVENLFYDCSSLVDITIPNSVKIIGKKSFAKCSNLKSVTMSNGVKTISTSAFASCLKLRNIYFSGSKDEWADIEIYDGNEAFRTATVNYNYCRHIWNDSSVTKKSTCTANGIKTYICTQCKATKTETIYYPKTISLSTTSYTYNGKVKKPSVTVKDSKGNKIASSNYTVSYSKGRKNVGKYSVKITFKGNYSGSKTLNFTIKPKATTISKVTAGKKAFTIKWKKQATQTTGYQIQCSTDKNFKKNNKIVTVSNNKTTSKKISKLSTKKKYYVRVRTYKTVKVNGKNTKIYSAWSKAKTVKTK